MIYIYMIYIYIHIYTVLGEITHWSDHHWSDHQTQPGHLRKQELSESCARHEKKKTIYGWWKKSTASWYGCFQKYGYPKMDGLWWKTLLKWMIWGYHHFRKHPYTKYPGTLFSGWKWWQTLILLMVQKSGVYQLRLVVSPIIYKVLYIACGCLGFLPPTVWHVNDSLLWATTASRRKPTFIGLSVVYFFKFLENIGKLFAPWKLT